MKKFPGIFTVGLMMAVVFSFLGGCATYPQKNFLSQATYGKGYDDVWETVVGTLNGMNMNIKTLEKTSGKIEVEGPDLELRKYVLGRYDSLYCYCVLPHQRNDLRKLVGNYAIALTRDSDNRTSVIIDATFLASVYEGEIFSGWLRCPSKGIFEPFLLKQVESQLSARKAPAPPPPEKTEKRTPSRNFDWWKPSRGY
ncbi:MAG: hypothetical protein WBX50_11250 [Candidatus Deferrimicrobiaceae bacterium]